MVTLLSIVHTAAMALFLLLMAHAAVSDVRSFEIPNWLSLATVACFLVAALAAGWGVRALALHLAAGIAVLVACAVLFVFNLMGGGDAKLLPAIAVWTGWGELAAYIFAVVLTGGGVAVVLIVFRRLPLPPRLAAIGWLRRLHSEEKGVPYALAIALPAIALFWLWPIAEFDTPP